ncbi:Sulfotransferase [Mactra antiquata]
MLTYITNSATSLTKSYEGIGLPKHFVNINLDGKGVKVNVKVKGNESKLTRDLQVDNTEGGIQSENVNVEGDIIDKGINDGNDNMNVGKQNRGTIFNDSLVYKTALDIHNHFYKPPKNQACEKRYPKCILLGVFKCGTRELMDFISVHPNIRIKTNPYEYSYFFKGDVENEKSRDQFLKNMPCVYDDQISFMKHAGYYSNVNAPKNIQKMDKNLKMILMVREPVQRFISQVWFRYGRRHSHLDLSQVTKMIENSLNVMPTTSDAIFTATNERFESTNVQTTSKLKAKVRNLRKNYIEMKAMLRYSVYDEPFERYLKYFDRDQILVIESEDFKQNPAAVLQNIESFLGLPKRINSDTYVFNEEKKHYCLKALNGTNVCYSDIRGRKYNVDLTESTKRKLKDFFRPHNERFFSLIGTRYAHWN